MLLQARKEFEILAELSEEDVFFYYTTTWVSLLFTPIKMVRIQHT